MEQLGKYQLVRKLATGGMAEVFLARSAGPLGFEKILVLKRILPHLAQDERFLAMFRSEATLAARLDHPNVVQIFDFGESDGEFYLAMEYIDGPTLRQALRRAAEERVALPLPFCAKVASLVCDGLAYAHDFCDPQTGQWLGIIHRDISPENILISRSGAVKVVDFGIAKAAAVSKTKSHSLRGKYGYLAPEQLRRKAPLDRRVDIYSLGVVLYELITGARPFEAASEMDVMQAILSERFAPASKRRPDVPADLDRILERALGRRDERYPTCQAFQVDLEAFLQRHGGAMTSQHLTKVIADLGLVSWGHSGPHSMLPLESLRLASPAESKAPSTEDAPADGAFPSNAPAAEGTSAPLAQTTGATLSDPHLKGLDLASAHTDPELETRDFGFQVVTGVVVAAALLLVILVYLISRREPPSPQPPPASAASVSPAPPPVLRAPALPTPASSRLASLRVESVPAGDVWLDDVLLGRSPVSIVNHPPGPALIRVSDRALGFRKEERIELAPGENGTKRIVVRRLTVELHVKPWAKATLDGRSLGRIAQERLDLFEGPHTLRLVNPVLRREQTVELLVRPGRDNVFWFDLYRR